MGGYPHGAGCLRAAPAATRACGPMGVTPRKAIGKHHGVTDGSLVAFPVFGPGNLQRYMHRATPIRAPAKKAPIRARTGDLGT